MIDPQAGPPDRSGTVRILRNAVPVRHEPEVRTMAAFLGASLVLVEPVTPSDGVWRITLTKAEYDALVAQGGRKTKSLPLGDGVASIEIVGP
jgi:hypothetical protein